MSPVVFSHLRLVSFDLVGNMQRTPFKADRQFAYAREGGVVR